MIYFKKISILLTLLLFCNISLQKSEHPKDSQIHLKPSIKQSGILNSNNLLIAYHDIRNLETCLTKVILKPNAKQPEKNYDNKFCYFLISDIKTDWVIHYFNTHWDIRNNTYPLIHLFECFMDSFRNSYFLSHDLMFIQHRLQL